MQAEKAGSRLVSVLCPFRSHTVTNYAVPTGNLDTVSAKKIMDNFTEINGRKKKAVVVVTHDPVVASYARRILFIKDGKIMKQMENHPKQQENIRIISDAMLDL